ncbi:MAG: hypothetical protein ACRDNF_02455, partial [Streptosporangiaceae bacterium]
RRPASAVLPAGRQKLPRHTPSARAPSPQARQAGARYPPTRTRTARSSSSSRTQESSATRYSTLGFQDAANLDDGDLWAVSFALQKWSAAVEKRVAELVKAAVS